MTNIINNNALEHDENNLQKILKFGRELFHLSSKLDDSENSANQKMLRVNIAIKDFMLNTNKLIKKVFFFF